MSEQHKIVFVTNDKWMLNSGGRLDKTDREILDDAGSLGEVVLMSMKEALERMEKEDPDKFEGFRQDIENQGSKIVTIDDIVGFSMRANEALDFFYDGVKLMMNERQAKLVRNWRVNGHYTWRLVSRTAFAMVVSRQWPKWAPWDPPANQLMGMAICRRGAGLLGQNFTEPPWN